MIIIEIQHSYKGETACITTTHNDASIAEQQYHQILAAASVSNVNVHSAVMLDDTGLRIKGETYYHGEA